MSFITSGLDGNFGSMTRITSETRIPYEKVLDILSKKDALGIPVPFTVEVATCDLDRKTGGEKVVYENAVLCTTTGSKKAYHNRNDARSIKLLNSGEIRSLQPILIIAINGQKVYL